MPELTIGIDDGSKLNFDQYFLLQFNAKKKYTEA